MSRTLTVLVLALCCLVAAFSLPAQQDEQDEQEKLLEQALQLKEQGKVEEARSLVVRLLEGLHELAEADPEDAMVWMRIGHVHFLMDSDDEANAAFDRAITLDPQLGAPWFFKGLIRAYADDLAGARELLMKAHRLDPQDPDVTMEIGRVLSREGKDAEALEWYRKTIELQGDHAEALYYTGVALIEAGKEEEALALFLRAFAAEPRLTAAGYNAGQISQNLGRHKEAVASFEAVVKGDPGDWQAITKLIQEYQALGEPEQRDAARGRLLALRAGGDITELDEAEEFCRAQLVEAGHRVLAFERFELAGDRPTRYQFVVLDKAGERREYILSLGSYPTINAIAIESGQLQEGERFFHLDGYYPDDSHSTFAFFKGEPSFDEILPMVRDIISGKREPISSMTPEPSSQESDPE